MSLEGMDGGFNEGTEDNVEETIESEESTNESIEVICDEIEPLETVEPLETIEDDNKIENVEAVNVEIPVIELEEENIKEEELEEKSEGTKEEEHKDTEEIKEEIKEESLETKEKIEVEKESETEEKTEGTAKKEVVEKSEVTEQTEKEMDEGSSKVIDEGLKTHLQSEYVTYEENRVFQSKLEYEKNELLDEQEKIEQTEKEMDEGSSKVIDEGLKTHLQSEYVTYEENRVFQSKLEYEKNELLDEQEKIEQSKEEIAEKLQDGQLTDAEKAELKEKQEQLETDQKNLDEKIELNEQQTGMLKVEEQEMRNISRYEMQGMDEKVSSIMEQFDAKEGSFKDAMDGKNSREFVEKCDETLGKLSEQKGIVESAKDLKYREIYDYVTKNSMDRYDTTYDRQYQQLLSEYRNIIQQSENIQTQIKTIDAQALSVGYYQNISYESKSNSDSRHEFHTSVYSDEELGIKEVKEDEEKTEKNIEEENESALEEKIAEALTEIKEGRDDPKTTDYFLDEAKVKAALESFSQENWENLVLDERKEAITKLVEYNQEILGIEIPVKIEYYEKNDRGDYGAYDKDTHTIFINAKNLEDAKETADTIAHEMRHAYQYVRAEELIESRDLLYSIGFIRYIQPAQNQSLYEQQLVETDARDYAQRYKDYIQSMENKK